MQLVVHTTTRHLVELRVPVAEKPSCGWPTPVAPEVFLKLLSEVRSGLAQQERNRNEDESCRSSEWKLEAGGSKRSEQ